MIKCPNCGSTAQVKEIAKKSTHLTDIAIIHTFYQCGCGERFWHYQSFNEFLGTIKEGYLKCKH